MIKFIRNLLSREKSTVDNGSAREMGNLVGMMGGSVEDAVIATYAEDRSKTEPETEADRIRRRATAAAMIDAMDD